MKKIFIVSIAIIAIGGLDLSLMAGKGKNYRKEISFEIEAIKEVVINNESWDLEFKNTESNKLTISVEGKQKDKKSDPVTIENNDEKIIINQQDEGGSFTNNFSFGKRGTIYISIPSNVLDTLSVNNSFGDIKMNAVKIENIVVSNDSGTGKMEGLSVEKGIFTSKDGELSIKNSSLNHLNVVSTSGDNYFTNVASNKMKITSKDGEVKVEDAAEGKSLLVETKSGDIAVSYKEVPTSQMVSASSDSSDISLKLDGLKINTNTEKSKVGTIGNATNTLDLISEDGTINVK